MTRLLGTFFETAGTSNPRGDLDGAAWRFVLPGPADTVEWQTTEPPEDRDVRAIARSAGVVRTTTGKESDRPDRRSATVVVGPFRDADVDDSRVGIDLVGGSGPYRLELRYEGDQLRGVVPRSDSIAREVLTRHVGADGPVPRSWKQRIRREPEQHRRTAIGSLRGVDPGPPAWLTKAALDAGIDVSDFGWALWCRGDYGSQKLILFLMPPSELEPSIVVKITRDPRFNDRLVNESDMLTRIARLPIAARGGAPTLEFRTTAWGSAVSAQSAVLGSDLRRHLPDRPQLVDRVTAWMSELAVTTQTPMVGDELHASLDALVDRYVQSYPVPSTAQAVLRAEVDRLAGIGVPAVLQHGDPGPWNAMLTADDTVAFLDWEAGEARGLPLWDLFYFLRSTSLLLSQRRPWQSRRSRTRRDLIAGSAVGDLVARHVRSYVEHTGLDHRAVEPLFYLCWVHRALKQARRVPVDRRDRGTFHRFVLDAVDGRHQAGLRRFTLASASGAGS